MDGIRHERQMLPALRNRADLLIDTLQSTPVTRERLLARQFTPSNRGLRVFVTCFSDPRGASHADRSLDRGFLKNANRVPALPASNGRPPGGAADSAGVGDLPRVFAMLWELLAPLLPGYEIGGKAYATVAVGCTGIRHRFVADTEGLITKLRAAGSGGQRKTARRAPPPWNPVPATERTSLAATI